MLLTNFNSIKVRLEQLISYQSTILDFNFNSIKVRLELAARYEEVLAMFDFNSIKVRLELVSSKHRLDCRHISIP